MPSLLPNIPDPLRNVRKYLPPRVGQSQPARNQDIDISQLLSPEDERSLVGKIGSASLSGLSRVANVLDLPGSMVRDLIAMENPLDQLLSPTTADNRFTGRDVLRKYGAIGKEDNWGNFTGGLAAEIALDPLTYLTFGTLGAASKGGQVLAKAGLSKFIPKAASAAAGRTVGKAAGRMIATSDDVLRAAVSEGGLESARALTRAAKASGFESLGAFRAAHGAKPVGGLFGLGLPFRPASAVFGKAGGVAEKVAGGLDTAGHALTYGKYSPFRPLVSLMDHRKRGMVGEQGMKFGEAATERAQMAEQAARRAYAPMHRLFQAADEFNPSRLAGGEKEALDNLLSVRAYGEKSGQLPAHLEKYRESIDDGLRIMNEGKQFVLDNGGKIDEWKSAFDTAYMPRNRLFPPVRTRGVKTERAFETGTPHAIARKQALDIPGGTKKLDLMSVDDEISGLIHRFPKDNPGGKLNAASRDMVKNVLRQRYALGELPESQLNSLAHTIANLDPWHQRTGIPMFRLNPVDDLFIYTLHAKQSGTALMHARTSLVENAQLANEVADEATEALGAVVPRFRGVDADKFAELVGREMQNASPEMAARYQAAYDAAVARVGADKVTPLSVLNDLYIPKTTAQNMTKFIGAYTTPETVSEIVEGLDKFLNLWKTWVTIPWPAFAARNRLSGAFNNFLGDAYNLTSELDADVFLRGPLSRAMGRRTSVQAMKIPEIARRAKSTEEATRLLGDELIEMGFIHHHHGVGGETIGSVAQGGLGPIPGEAGIYAARPDVSFGQRINPYNVRGAGSDEQVLGIARWGENLNTYVEGMNRVSPYITLRTKGYAKSVAKQMVDRMQVNYQAVSGFHKAYVRRAFPFATFTLGTLPFIVESLITKPGGKLAQTLRTMNRLRGSNALTPDYVAETASIPLGEQPDGSDRYLTGFGLMFEDAFQFAGGPRQGGLEALSRLNPLLKTPLEMATGQSFFQKGPMGGRPIEDLDPTIGRIAANLTGRDEAVRYPGSQSAEALLSATPLTRAATSLRTATDPRKGLLGRAANLGTGFRISDVSPGAQDTILRERAEVLMKELGAKTFQRTYFPKERLETMSPNQLLKAMELQALQNELARRAKERKAAKAALENAARR